MEATWTGFYMAFGHSEYFMESNSTKRTDKICRAFIERIGTDRNKSRDLIDRAKADKPTLNDFRRRIDSAVLKKTTKENGFTYYTISGEGFSFGYPVEDFMNDVIVF